MELKLDEKLKEFGTPHQAKVIDAINEHGGVAAAARHLEMDEGSMRKIVRILKKKAAMAGHSPDHDMTRTVPEPYVVKGVSTYYNADGEPRGQWVKSQLDQAKAREAIEEWVQWLTQDAKGLSPTVNRGVDFTPPSATDKLVVYPIGDPHFGMYSWALETGADFDLEIAENTMRRAIERVVACAPPTDTALIIELGDFFHSDNNSARTERSGNQLDVDTRYARVLQVGLRAMVHSILTALTKHKNVVVRIVQGNHDTHSALFLSLALNAWFHNEPRVTIDMSPAVFWYYEFGAVLIGATHGDTCKTDKLPSLMAFDMPEAWGRTKHRVFHHGHIHHDGQKEYPGCIVEHHQTLAARDAWHAASGYRAGQGIKAIVYDKKHGEVERYRIDIGQLTGDK